MLIDQLGNHGNNLQVTYQKGYTHAMTTIVTTSTSVPLKRVRTVRVPIMISHVTILSD